MTTTTLPSHDDSESDSDGNDDDESILNGESLEYDLQDVDDSSIPYF
jgi:hypothetical protein